MNWFQSLFGFTEESPEQVRANLLVEDLDLISKANGKRYQLGELAIPTLQALRQNHPLLKDGHLTIREVVGDVQDYHCMPDSQGALFQAASQFNLLEMVNPAVTPEMGLWRYAHDHTQGPACAIACGAGTVYRNYFAEIKGSTGQTAGRQIDTLEGIAAYFNNDQQQLWQMKNGYALANSAGLDQITSTIDGLDQEAYLQLKGLLQIGLQLDSQVTIFPQQRIVSQAYCSALPVAYSSVAAEHWESFARLILEATYEATLYAGLLNRERTGNRQVYLTLVGGGAFGNKSEWIVDAVAQALQLFKTEDLEVVFISYGGRSEVVARIMERFKLD